jgi:hypothetical protein
MSIGGVLVPRLTMLVSRCRVLLRLVVLTSLMVMSRLVMVMGRSSVACSGLVMMLN